MVSCESAQLRVLARTLGKFTNIPWITFSVSVFPTLTYVFYETKFSHLVDAMEDMSVFRLAMAGAIAVSFPGHPPRHTSSGLTTTSVFYLLLGLRLLHAQMESTFPHSRAKL